MQELHGSVLGMVDEFKKQKLLEAIELCESDMFSKISKHSHCLMIFPHRYARGAECVDSQQAARAIHRV